MAIFDNAESNGGDIPSDMNVTGLPASGDKVRCWTSRGFTVTREPRRLELSSKRLMRPCSTRELSLRISESVLSSTPLSHSKPSHSTPSSSGTDSVSKSSFSLVLLSSSSSCAKDGRLCLFCGSSCLRKSSSVVGVLRFEIIILVKMWNQENVDYIIDSIQWDRAAETISKTPPRSTTPRSTTPAIVTSNTCHPSLLCTSSRHVSNTRYRLNDELLNTCNHVCKRIYFANGEAEEDGERNLPCAYSIMIRWNRFNTFSNKVFNEIADADNLNQK